VGGDLRQREVVASLQKLLGRFDTAHS
jgi:hypothetical protein